jgi:hypothetical protein
MRADLRYRINPSEYADTKKLYFVHGKALKMEYSNLENESGKTSF